MTQEHSPSSESEPQNRQPALPQSVDLSLTLGTGLLPPIDPHDVGAAMFSALCQVVGWMQLNEGAHSELKRRYEAVIARLYFGAEEHEALKDQFDLAVQASALDPDGRTVLLVTIEDQDTGNFILPCRMPGSESEQYALIGGSSAFQGILLTIVKTGTDQAGAAHIHLSETYLTSSFTTLTELSRIALGDFRSPFGNLVERALAGLDDSTVNVARICSAAFNPEFPLMMPLLLQTEKGQYLLAIGDRETSGLTDIQYCFRFRDPLCGDRTAAARPIRPSERIISSVSDLAEADGDVLLRSQDQLNRYHYNRVAELVTNHLFDRSNGIWDVSWDVSLHAVRVTPEGAVRCIAAVTDKEDRFHVPWLAQQSVDREIASESFIGIAVEVRLPESLLPGVSEKSGGRDLLEPCVEQVLSHAYLTEDAMDQQIELLSHRTIASDQGASDDEVKLSSTPSSEAKRSVFFPELERAIQQDLVDRGIITAPQGPALSLKNIQVAFGKRLGEMGGLEIDRYLVRAEHQWGTNVVTFGRIKDIGTVPFSGLASSFLFFPRSQYVTNVHRIEIDDEM